MITLLEGPNSSGRSAWLAQRRKNAPWPASVLIGPFPELACTGLTSTVAEEIACTFMKSAMTQKRHRELVELFSLAGLMANDISALSGGECVRVALMSIAAQGIRELHVDTSFEQLDPEWRDRLMRFIAQSENVIAPKIFVSDNHLTTSERALFHDIVEFRAELGSELSGPSMAFGGFEHFRGHETVPIVVDKVSFGYGSRSAPVFKDASLTLEPGVLHFLVGPNGSGKTTFVKLLSGTLLPQTGSIWLGSKAFRAGFSRQRFAALAFQNPDFQWTSYSVRSELDKILNDPIGTPEDALLTAFGIPASCLDISPYELPFVWKKRLSVALVFFAKKPWLIFDEPTLGQDVSYSVALARAIHNVLKLGGGAVVISHDVGFRALFPDARHWQFGNQRIVPQ